ncbi:MBL fold metallo-hydrolase [Nocardioides sp.]|uniref:MBL fold metallo-hydrolase n=1 Tax=Nocardioides sp. TaxID=35761 RepID=UPI0025D32133|nr:MBL fold metallo-hydrolase [Nocardioides sp.]
MGTATTLLRLGPFTVLTDPDFLHRGQHAYLGKGLFSRRVAEPSMQPAQLPRLDAVALSHLHGDHFDRVPREQLDRDLPVLTTPAAARRLGKWGFGNAAGFAPWEQTTLTSDGHRLVVTAVPGRHAPGIAQALLPPVMGSVLELHNPGASTPFRLYITGDTLYRPWLRDVRDRAGEIDAMVIHLGGTRILGMTVTMDGDQGAQLVELIEPSVTVPVHHDDYRVFRSPLPAPRSPLQEFLDECHDRSAPTTIWTVARGERVPLGRE